MQGTPCRAPQCCSGVRRGHAGRPGGNCIRTTMARGESCYASFTSSPSSDQCGSILVDIARWWVVLKNRSIVFPLIPHQVKLRVVLLLLSPISVNCSIWKKIMPIILQLFSRAYHLETTLQPMLALIKRINPATPFCHSSDFALPQCSLQQQCARL